MSDQEKVVNCYRGMYRGMIDKNRNALSEVLDDSFVLGHMTGRECGSPKKSLSGL